MAQVMQSVLWTSEILGENAVITTENNVLDVTFNNVAHQIIIPEGTYNAVDVLASSELADKINDLFIEKALPVAAKLGILKDGKNKSPYIVFLFNEGDLFEYDGTFKNVVGATSFITIQKSEFRSSSFSIEIEEGIKTIEVSRNPKWTYTLNQDLTWNLHYSNETTGESYDVGTVQAQDGKIVHIEKGLAPLTMHEYEIQIKDANGSVVRTYNVKSKTGSRRQLFTKNGGVNMEASVSVSADGSLITWGDNRKGNMAIGDMYLLNVDTGAETPVVEDDFMQFKNTIAKDGSKVAYVTEATENLFTYVHDASTNTILWSSTVHNPFLPKFSKDINHILFVEDMGTTFSLKVYSINNGNVPVYKKDGLEKYVVPVAVSDDGKRVIYCVQKDGITLVYACNMETGAVFEVYKINSYSGVDGVDSDLSRIFCSPVKTELESVTIDWAGQSSSAESLLKDVDAYLVRTSESSNIIAINCFGLSAPFEHSIRAMNLDTGKWVQLTDDDFSRIGSPDFDVTDDMNYIIYSLGPVGYVEYVGHLVDTIR